MHAVCMLCEDGINIPVVANVFAESAERVMLGHLLRDAGSSQLTPHSHVLSLSLLCLG